jgi:hypothetical protein
MTDCPIATPCPLSVDPWAIEMIDGKCPKCGKDFYQMPKRENIIMEICVERNRQITVEGYDAKHDQQHEPGTLATGAAFYALPTETTNWIKAHGIDLWPFIDHPKRKDRRRDLVRAAAMIVAEIEDIDRAKASANG